MSQSMNVLVQLPLSGEQRARLEAAAPEAAFMYVKPKTITAEQVAVADAIVGNVRPELLAGASRLRLLQLNSAGYEQYAVPGVLPAGCALCCATGAYGQAVSEHLFAMVLSQVKRLPGYHDLQRAHEWGDLGPVATLHGAHVLVLGAGDIGTHLAGLFAAMGAEVTGVRSHAAEPHAPFTAMATMSELPELLPKMDVVCSVLPSTPSTRGVADQRFFSLMRPGAYFANAGRGDLVDQEALVAALESGHLAGAALDVCVPEPLPVDSPLWDAPNLLLTPHVSGQFHLAATLENIVDIAAQNLAHLTAGEPLRNHVN